jgi:hypothetical protein
MSLEKVSLNQAKGINVKRDVQAKFQYHFRSYALQESLLGGL